MLVDRVLKNPSGVALLRGLWLAVALVHWAASAAAQPADSVVDSARQHYAQGEVLFEAENFEGALAEFQAAFDLLEGNPSQAGIAYNIGQCHERLFRYGRALEFYQRYLELAGEDAEDAADVRASIRALEGLLGTIHVTTNVEHAEVWVDDLLVGEAPGDILVPGGRHTLELRAPGYLPARREVQLAARGSLDESMPLEPVPDDTRLEPIWCLLAGGVALVAAGIGTGFWVDAQSQWDAAGGLDLGDGAQARIDAAALTGDVLYGTAALFAVTSITLAFFTRWEGAPAAGPDARALIVPLPGGAALLVGGSF